MDYISTQGKTPACNLKKAVLHGLAEDGGLFVPEHIPTPSGGELDYGSDTAVSSLAQQILTPFLKNEVAPKALTRIVEETFSFDIPLKQIEERIWSLELFHGPTLAFKDVGARFLARLLDYFMEGDEKITVLVATSGDTGSAVAHGFSGMKNVKVVLLYPAGKVSTIQEQQLTTAGANVTALKVQGDFDDCQRLVKEAFADKSLRNRMKLTSANSINIARWLPQSVYYAVGLAQLPDQRRDLVFSVPSGNYGNLTAGIIIKKMGFPVRQFIAASNINDTIPAYLASGQYQPKPSRQTLSNAMDVGNPSNFERLTYLFENNYNRIKNVVSGTSYSDNETLRTIAEVYEQQGYILDPHGAIGYRGLKDFMRLQKAKNMQGIFLETAHPAKFGDTVEQAIGHKIEMPARLQACLSRTSDAVNLKPAYDAFRDFLLGL